MPSFLSSDLESGGDSVLIDTTVPTLPSSLIFPILDQVHEGLAERSEQRRLIICKHDRRAESKNDDDIERDRDWSIDRPFVEFHKSFRERTHHNIR